MTIQYFGDTDTALIDFSNRHVAETIEVSENVYLDIDDQGNVVSMTIEHAQDSMKPTMKLNYYSDTDTLYIDLAERPGVDAEEVSPDVVLDRDADGRIVGIEIERASEKADLTNVTFAGMTERRAR